MATVADETFPWLHVTFIRMYKARPRHSPASEHPLALGATWTAGNKEPGGAPRRARAAAGCVLMGGNATPAAAAAARPRAPASSRRRAARTRLGSLAPPTHFFFFLPSASARDATCGKYHRRSVSHVWEPADSDSHSAARSDAKRAKARKSAREKKKKKKNGGRGAFSPFSASLTAGGCGARHSARARAPWVPPRGPFLASSLLRSRPTSRGGWWGGL